MPTDRAAVAVVGSANADLHVELDHLPQPGETVLGSRSRWLAGGKGANQAAAAARLGADVRLVAAIGDDAAGGIALAGLDADGVDLGAVRRVADTATGVAMVCVDGRGENLIVVAPGANAVLAPADVDIAGSCRAVLASLEVPATTVLAALRRARAIGATAVLNASPAASVDPSLLAAADVIVVNEGEARALGLQWPPDGDPDDVLREGADGLVAPRVGPPVAPLAAAPDATVVATAGSRGAGAWRPGHAPLHVPAPAVEVVDTVGAGDCLAAGLTVALAEGRSLADALAFGVAAATLAVGRAGARGLPTRAEVDALRRPG